MHNLDLLMAFPQYLTRSGCIAKSACLRSTYLKTTFAPRQIKHVVVAPQVIVLTIQILLKRVTYPTLTY